MGLSEDEEVRLHWTTRSFLFFEEGNMNVSWKLLEVGRNFLAGYKEIFLATQLVQELPSTWSMLDFARELHECLTRAFKADPESVVFVLTTVSVAKSGEVGRTPLFDAVSGDVPPGKVINVDSDPEIDLGPSAPREIDG